MNVRVPSFVGFLRFWLQYKLTPLGRAAVFVIFLSAIGLITVEVPVYQTFCVSVALFGIAEVTGLCLRPKLAVQGSLPERISVGETATGYVQIENKGYLPACDIMCGIFNLPSGLRQVDGARVLPALRRHEQGVLPFSVQAKRRGEYSLPALTVHSTFPLNLMRFGRASMPIRKLTVVPTYHRLEQLTIPISQRYQPGGIIVESRSGDAPEYVGNRDYIPGEPARRLDFRAWARVGKPVVREYQDEYCSRVALVLDTHQRRGWFPGRGRDFRQIEAAVSLTAAVADALNETETMIDLFAAGPDLFLFQTSSGTTHFDSVLEILAAVEPTRHNPLERLSPVIAESLESTSLVICVFVDWDESRETLTRRIIECGCELRVVLVSDRPPLHEFPNDETYSRITPDEILSGAVRNL